MDGDNLMSTTEDSNEEGFKLYLHLEQSDAMAQRENNYNN